MTDLSTLERVKQRISNPKNHTKGTAARTAEGFNCRPKDPEATCWCLIGACIAEESSFGLAQEQLAETAWPMSLVQVNDMMGHEAVLLLIDKTIERLSKQG